jgi:EAL domain-containing protein (putative c-di-GMP-specific phosphodiesterase class I)
MYVAKRGHLDYAVYSPENDQHTPARITLASELRQAIAAVGSMNEAARGRSTAGRLSLHYQPVIDLRSGECDHLEALARWEHPERGFVPPGEFIPVAEHVGLIKDLTLLVLAGALRQLRQWFEHGMRVRAAINLSARGLHDPQFAAAVARMIRRAAISPTWLTLEITESAVMADPERSMQTLARLHDLGIRISIDDFGTGYSSLAYLQRLPVDEIKIDRSFTSRIVSSRDDSFIVRSITDLGHNRGAQVVAEGVEDEETLAMLRELGCDLAQGYGLARPMPVEAMTEWLRGHLKRPV